MPKKTDHRTPNITILGAGPSGADIVGTIIGLGLPNVKFAVSNPPSEAHNAVNDAQLVIVTTLMDDGIGSAIATMTAKLARDNGQFVVGIVGTCTHADNDVQDLRQCVDALVVIPASLPSADTTANVHNEIYEAVRTITNVVNGTGLFALDLDDLRHLLHGKGMAIMGTGQTYGQDRAVTATEAAITSSAQSGINRLNHANAVLINITGGCDMALDDINQAVDRLRREITPETNVMFGTHIDETMTAQALRVSFIMA